ncbi:putative autotransporter protein [Acidisarcina polymorpha]|uniref:Putative autotransporter protein n=1 Tax=Acidisarcina polymorpha TaxID=2211140 RepID=A0A2Z5G928_9BACT|nr:hypothetical protein [Acidisarcina polymorpha]AXC15480.1 putative autotransporter protein [Acidisarcina polymorpha]
MSISTSLQRIVVASIFLISISSLSAQTIVPWLTHSMDNARSGWNSHETQLTQASVGTKGIVRSTIIALGGNDARGMEAQPLILPQVTTPLGVRDVLVLPSMANVVRGVDAHDGSGIWQTVLGTPITGTKAIDMWQINQFWGCLSTGVIDPDLKRLYQVCWIVPNAQGTPLPPAPASTEAKVARYFMFVLNVGDGTLVADPVMIQGTSNGADFNAFPRKQRSSLLETDVNGLKTVFGCSGTINETDPGAAGYCFAFDVATDKETALFATTSGAGAGIWMAGQGAAADPDGNLYVITGNGDFDGAAQWAESFLKLHYTPPSAQNQGGIRVVDHWTPWTDLARSSGQPAPQGKLAGVSAPSEPMMAMNRPVGASMNMSFKGAVTKSAVDAKGNLVVRVYPKIPTGDWSDEDWGSAGPACIFSLGICIASGKDGIAYPIKTASMGGTTLKDLKNPPANCTKLAGPPVWLTVDPGPVDPCPKDPKTLNFFPWGVTAHMHMTPVQFFDPLLQAWTIFAWGENYQLHKWKVSLNGQLTYLAQGNQVASIETPHTATHHGGMTGGFCSGSSNGSDPNSAILVCTIPYNDANQDKTNGRLLIYDPIHLAADGSLKLLWDSQAQGIPFLFNKFNPPIIDGGQIYVPNYSGGVDLYRLTP